MSQAALDEKDKRVLKQATGEVNMERAFTHSSAP
jgi:hypothetical protein